MREFQRTHDARTEPGKARPAAGHRAPMAGLSSGHLHGRHLRPGGFQQVGLDAQIQYFQDMGQFWLVDADMSKLNTPTWRDEVTTISSDPDNRIAHHTIHTPDGTLTYKTAGDRKTTWITEYLIKHDEDIELIRKYMPVPALTPRRSPSATTRSATPASCAASCGATRRAAGSTRPASTTSPS